MDQTACVQALLEQGSTRVHASWTNPDGLTSLLTACHHDQVACAQTLVCMGGQRLPGLSQVHVACALRTKEDLAALLAVADNKQALRQATTNDLLTPLHLACYLGRADIVQLLVELQPSSLVDLNAKDKLGMTPLAAACCTGRKYCVSALFPSSVNDGDRLEVNQADNYGWTPLYHACYFGHFACIEMLLAKAGDRLEVNKADKNGFTPLHVACENGHSACIEMLLAKAGDRLDVNQADKDGLTPLYKSCQIGRSACIEMLLAKASDVNQVRSDGCTLLNLAVQNGHLACCKNLLRIGANPHLQDKSGKSANDLVREQPSLLPNFDDMSWIWQETLQSLSALSAALRVFNTTVPVDLTTQLATARVSFALLRTVRLTRCQFADGRALSMLATEQQRQDNITPVHWHLEDCPKLGSDAVVSLFSALLSASMDFTLRITDCNLDTKGIEQLGSFLFYASEENRQRIKGFELSDKRLQVRFETAKALQDSLIRSPLVDMVLLGDGGVGKTQFEARLRGDSSASVLRTLGANSHQSSLRRQHLSSSFLMSVFQQPRKVALGDTGFFLGDILEVGGQLEYRYLYQFVGSLFRLHVIVLRHPAGTSFPSLENQLKEHLQILACRYPRTSELECPAIIVVVNHDEKQASEYIIPIFSDLSAALPSPTFFFSPSVDLQWRRRLGIQETQFATFVQQLCHPGLCKTVFLNAKDGENFGQFHTACGELWRRRGSFVTSERKRLVDSLHRHVISTCNLQIWSDDCQWIRTEHMGRRMPVHVLTELLTSLDVPTELHGVATEQLVEACEIVLLPKQHEGELQRVVSWPQFVFDVTALLIHDKDAQITTIPKKLPAHQQRDGALLQLIKVLHEFVFRRSDNSESLASIARLQDFAAMMEDHLDPLFAASVFCRLAVDLGICFLDHKRSAIHLPALLPEALPDDMSRVWPALAGKERAIGVCLMAANNGVFPPGLFQRLQVQIGRQVVDGADVALWQRGLAIAGVALTRLTFVQQKDAHQSLFDNVSQELLTRCFVRIEQAQHSAVSLYAVCHGEPENDPELLVLHKLLQHSILLLDHVRQSAGIAGLSWDEQYVHQTVINSIFTASRDNPVYLRPFKTIPRAEVEAEVRAGSQDHKLTAPHLYVRPKPKSGITVLGSAQDVNISNDFMSAIFGQLCGHHHSLGLNFFLPSFERSERTDSKTASLTLERTVKLRQHALGLVGYTWPTPASSATTVDLKTGLHRCGLGFIWAEISPMVGGAIKLPSFGFFKECYAAVDSSTLHDLPIYLALSSAGWTSAVRFERENDLLAQSNLTARLLQPMLQFSQRWTPRGVVDEREKQVLKDMLEVCGLSATLGVLEYLQWNSLPVFVFAAELMLGDVPLWQAIRSSLPQDISDLTALKLLDRVFDPQLTLSIVAEAPQAPCPEVQQVPQETEAAAAAEPEGHQTEEDNEVTFNEALRRDVDALDAPFRGDTPEQLLFNPDGTHAITLRDLRIKDNLLFALGCCGLIFRPRACVFYFTGHGRKMVQDSSKTELVFCNCEHCSDPVCSACSGLTARDLSPALWAIGASTTLVVLDCCFSSGVFSLEMFPGLAIMPVVSADGLAVPGFARDVFIPILRRASCGTEGCRQCHLFSEQCASGQTSLMHFMEHVRHFISRYTNEMDFPAFTVHQVSHSAALFNNPP